MMAFVFLVETGIQSTGMSAKTGLSELAVSLSRGRVTAIYQL